MTWTYYWAGTSGDQPRYNQFDFQGCKVGCGPVAWTMLLCWADRQAALGNTYWAPRTGLYRVDGGRGADDVAPIAETSGVDNVIREIHGEVGTFCIFGSGATFPWDMPGVWQYINGRSYTRVRCDWDSLGIHEDGLRDLAISSIRDRHTPAVIGIGWLSHYPLAWGYAWQTRTIRRCFIFCWDDVVTDRWFYVNEGWGQGGAGQWVEASTWFAGQIFP